jgi:transposase InsO family protein
MCEACQNFSPHQAKPSTKIQLITLIWPLQRWGINLVSPCHLRKGKKFAVIAVEYFIRWIEAKPLASITSDSVKNFFWQNIVCRFRVPRTLTVDNGKQFDSDKFKEFCTIIGTKLAFTSVYHQESNGAVEWANKAVFSAISKTLFNLRKGKWVEELPKVVWSHNTTASRTTGFTPFKLLYGEEVMIPEEIKHESLRAMQQTIAEDEDILRKRSKV